MAEKNWKSFVAGATAGGIESAITYPFEFAKTRLQLLRTLPSVAETVAQGAPTADAAVSITEKAAKVAPRPATNPFSLIYQVVRNDGFGAIYAGCVPFVIGNTAKAGVRFLGFDTLRGMLRDKDGNLSTMRGALAGLGAGALESVVALTPGESIKTALIDDRRGAQRYSGKGFAGTRLLIKENGIGLLYRGVLPVTARQAANSTIRLGSYQMLRTMWENRKGATLTSGQTFALGALVGTITVYTTMPIDTVKTRMQAVSGPQQHSGMIRTFMSIVKNDGVKALWRGSTARLGRLVMSGGIVFTIYEEVMRILK